MGSFGSFMISKPIFTRLCLVEILNLEWFDVEVTNQITSGNITLSNTLGINFANTLEITLGLTWVILCAVLWALL